MWGKGGTAARAIAPIFKSGQVMQRLFRRDGRLFLHRVLGDILVYREYVEINLKTGLGVNDEFDASLTVDRKEI